MNRSSKILLAAALLAAGYGAATLFGLPERPIAGDFTSTESAQAGAPSAHDGQQSLELVGSARLMPDPNAESSSRFEFDTRLNDSEAARSTTSSPTESDALPVAYWSVAKPPEPTAGDSVLVESVNLGAPLLPLNPEMRELAPPQPPPAELRNHIVSDGDSLPKLAGRYLRDANRADEIFVLNRDVLTNPELLPIGVELKIPPREHGQTLGRTESTETASTAAASNRAAPGLVPLQLAPTSSSTVPRAQLQRPVSVGW